MNLNLFRSNLSATLIDDMYIYVIGGTLRLNQEVKTDSK